MNRSSRSSRAKRRDAQSAARTVNWPRFDLALFALAVLFLVLWMAGGASREDVLGQPVVRGASWLLLAGACLLGRPLRTDGLRPVILLLAVTVMVTIVQLVPLPPAVWQSLPGRAMFRSAVDAGAVQPWRPVSLAPGATWNALASLVVPTTTLLLVAKMGDAGRERTIDLLFALIGASLAVALVQASTGGSRNPFINDFPDQLAGPFANRNHFALFMSIGCMVAPVWALQPPARRWRVAFGFGVIPVMLISIIAVGSRSGIVLGSAGAVLGLYMVGNEATRALQRYAWWVKWVVVAGSALVLVGIVVLTLSTGKAASFDRIMMDDQAGDLRWRTLPVVMEMIRFYFPFGSGMGTFDPIYRIHEPFELLRLTYFNHAHNDFLEIVLGAGLPGLLLLIAGIGWWAWVSFHAWRPGGSMISRLGSAILLSVFASSVVDYPARTPIMMATVVLAGAWLARARAGHGATTLRGSDRLL